MNTKFFILILSALAINSVYAQNITNTLGTNGLFSVKYGSTTYLSLNQTDGLLTLNSNLNLSNTSSPTQGIINKGGTRFIHNYQAPSTGGSNFFAGYFSGNFTMSGSNNQASYNTGLGAYTLSSLTTGNSNTVVGTWSMYFNSTGSFNSALGYGALFNNTSGEGNTALGFSSLYNNNTGTSNTGVGKYSLYFNSNGYNNTAIGDSSLYANTTGYQNAAFGTGSLRSNTIGTYNTAFGNYSLHSHTGILANYNSAFGTYALYNTVGRSSNSAFGFRAMFSLTTGEGNASFGAECLSNVTTGSNNIGIGNNAQVPSSTGSSQVRIGNTGIIYAGIQVPWTITSDRRWKENIISSPLGLSFINKLNPVSYSRINDESMKTEYGLIAQEVEEVLIEEKAENTAMITVTDEGNYELRYNDLLAPMIKAIQELKTQNDELNKENEKLKQRLEIVEETIRTLKDEKLVNASNERNDK